ncbi:phage tail fiber protein [Mycobacteroides chelonae]|uniref:phage tail fiber protein n=1 Tax=Mycobacteroides chelonae TaxID=1774 RepID=UPI000991901C
MAWGMSTYLTNKILDHICRNVAYTPPATVYAKMHTGDPGAAGTANASSVATRYACAFAAAAAGSISQSNTPEHTLGATENIAGVSFWDHPTTGNFLWSSQATVSKSGASGDIIRINSDTLNLAPLAA